MGWMNDPIADSPSPTNANGDVSSFVQQYGPLADSISQKLGVSPDLILGKLGLETAWGKKVIPGTNNLGNIKDVSGRGTVATDNYAGSRDAYLKFEDPETFGSYYSDFIQRLYPNAVGAGSDAKKFTEGLAKGKNGAYAEDPNYGSKVTNAAGMVTKVRGGAQGGWMNDPANEGTAPLTKVDKAEIPPPPQSKPDMGAPAKPKQEPKSVLRRVDDLVRGAADTLTFGYSDEIAAGLDRLFGINTGKQGGPAPKNYDEALKAQRDLDKEGGAERVVGQVAGAFVPVFGAASKTATAARSAEGATRLARAGAAAKTAGVTGALYGSGSAEGDLFDRATGAVKGGATGIALGGTVGALLPATKTQVGNEFIKKAGGENAAKLDAEIVKDLSKIAGNTNNRGNPVQAVQANALETKYINDVQSAIKSFGKKGLEKIGTSADDINNALANKRIITPEELQTLRTSKAGNALADAIEKAQRTRSLTAAVPAADNILARTGRTVLDIAPIPQAVRYLGQRALGSRQTREDVIQKLLKDRNVSGAENVLERLGPSQATQSLSTLQKMAEKAQTTNKARIAQEQAAKTASLAEKAQVKNQVLQTSKMPLGGGFQELLPGGASGLNLSSDAAIKALRIVSKTDKNSPVAKAASEILKSNNVKDPNAFYGVQNTIRRLSEEGKIVGSTQSGGVLSSGVRNPISYQANVNNAMEAVKLARDSAPTKALGQFASTVAGTKSPAEKLKLVEARLAKATDPAEIDFLNNFVRPLTSFGKK